MHGQPRNENSKAGSHGGKERHRVTEEMAAVGCHCCHASDCMCSQRNLLKAVSPLRRKGEKSGDVPKAVTWPRLCSRGTLETVRDTEGMGGERGQCSPPCRGLGRCQQCRKEVELRAWLGVQPVQYAWGLGSPSKGSGLPCPA